ncbi:MAG TPA: hypothetical protein VGC41_25805, partial [Kofleriaceae bacterium]
LDAAAPSFDRCSHASVVVLSLDIDASGNVGHARATSANKKDDTACVVTVAKTLHFAPTATHVTWPVKGSGNCDELTEQGTDAEARGDHSGALVSYDLALKCTRNDPHIVALAFMASCNAGNKKASQRLWKKLSTSAQSRLLQICVRSHIDQQMLDQ